MSDDKRALVTSAAGGDLSEILSADGCGACLESGRLDDGRTPCPACDGSGRRPKPARSLCANCHGYKVIPELVPQGENFVPTGRQRSCPSCAGSGLRPPDQRRRIGTALMVGGPAVALYATLFSAIIGVSLAIPFVGGAVMFFGGLGLRTLASRAELKQARAPQAPRRASAPPPDEAS